MNTFKSDTASANSRTPSEVKALLSRHIDGIRWVTRRESFRQDKQGTDYLVYMWNGTVLHVDIKELSYIPASAKDDRVLLETEILGSRVRNGWATDESKNTDVFLIVRGDDSTVFLWATTLRRLIKRDRKSWQKTGISREGVNLTQGIHEVFACRYITVPVSILENECRLRAA